MLPVTDKFIARPMSRREIISRLGVSYAHKGGWRQPIVEMPGAGRKSFTPTISLFSHELNAIAHVRSLARRAAETDLKRAEGLLEGPLVKLRLWLAQNVMFFREREIGLIQTEAVMSGQLREARAIINGVVPVSFVRMQESMVCPPILDPGQTVYLVDSRGFPNDAARLTETVITTRLICSPRPGHDIGLKYEIDGVSAVFEIEDRSDGHLVLVCGDKDLVAYGDRALAQGLLDSLAHEADGILASQEPETDAANHPAQKRHVSRLLDRVGHIGGLAPAKWRGPILAEAKVA